MATGYCNHPLPLRTAIEPHTAASASPHSSFPFLAIIDRCAPAAPTGWRYVSSRERRSAIRTISGMRCFPAMVRTAIAATAFAMP